MFCRILNNSDIETWGERGGGGKRGDFANVGQ